MEEVRNSQELEFVGMEVNSIENEKDLSIEKGMDMEKGAGEHMLDIFNGSETNVCVLQCSMLLISLWPNLTTQISTGMPFC